MLSRLAVIAVALVASSGVLAAVVAVNEPWVRPAGKGGATQAFMEITASEDATVVDARSPVAAKVALARGEARAAPPFALLLAAREPLRMGARGTHLVLSNVERELKRGERVAITLVLRYADGTTQEVPVDAEVRRRSPSQDHGVHRH